jgi:hypothetical protein
MSIMLPSAPGIRTAKPRLLDFGGLLTPAGGGAVQKLNRLGNRFAMDIEFPPTRTEADGRIFSTRLARALTLGVMCFVLQPGLIIGAPGSVLIDGNGQTGSTLNLKGFAAGYVVREGQFFSIIHAGRRYLHMAAEDLAASGGGTMVLPIVPMLRISPSDGDTVEFAAPIIEGWLSGNMAEWQLLLEPFTQISPITITEAE